MTDPRLILDRVLAAALASVDPGRLIAERLAYDGRHLVAEAGGQSWRGDLDAFRRVLVLGAGKAAARMAQAIEAKLGERVSGGLVVVKHGHHLPLRRIAVAEAGHPTPDEAGIDAARRLAALADQAEADTLVILLLSGGGSALLCAPREDSGLTLADKQAVTAALLASGADIAAINCVRKHLSALKGGRLLARLAPARCLALILSDVIGDRLDVIASGPVSPDPTSYADALAVLDAHDLRQHIPAAARTLLEQGAAGQHPETLKPDDPRLELVTPLVLGNTLTAVRAARDAGMALGLPTLSLTASLCGEAREAGRQLYAIGRDLRDHALLAPPPALLVSGGETTVTLGANPGLGGRNQELALSFLCALTRDPAQGAGLHLLAAATDGGDGPTDAAGAYASAAVLTRARSLGLSLAEALARHDSYRLFAATGDLLRLGPTLTNVCDLQLLLVTPSP
ncbi:glycerate kinase type-2 family protein [Phaeospirillum tilakii]|uniref:Glycerate kinase n=1 Tax=Phaeospirillum tilakii TaxID=741673 RepID=A0ABW5CCY6_9PROT